MVPPLILLRSSWQSINIGDIAHTPGLLSVFNQYLPEARVVLWPCEVENGAEALLRRHFPKLEIVHGKLDENGKPDTDELDRLWRNADLFLHGSGPAPMRAMEAASWNRQTGKPFGFFGITAEQPSPEQIEALKKASFVFTRETKSLEILEKSGISGPDVRFCPDATFSCAITNEDAAASYLRETGLEPGTFLCVLPRLRYTPYYRLRGFAPNQEDLRRDQVNATHGKTDHAKVCEAIVRLVREDGLKILLCPEMAYEVEIMDELLIAPLPEDVRASVFARRSYWLTDEATSVYRRSRGLISFECHSPILAIRQGIPALYIRNPTDTIKGQMYRDLGLNEWILECDEVNGKDVYSAVSKYLRQPAWSREKIEKALELANNAYRAGVDTVRRLLA